MDYSGMDNGLVLSLSLDSPLPHVLHSSPATFLNEAIIHLPVQSSDAFLKFTVLTGHR